MSGLSGSLFLFHAVWRHVTAAASAICAQILGPSHSLHLCGHQPQEHALSKHIIECSVTPNSMLLRLRQAKNYNHTVPTLGISPRGYWCFHSLNAVPLQVKNNTKDHTHKLSQETIVLTKSAYYYITSGDVTGFNSSPSFDNLSMD